MSIERALKLVENLLRKAEEFHLYWLKESLVLLQADLQHATDPLTKVHEPPEWFHSHITRELDALDQSVVIYVGWDESNSHVVCRSTDYNEVCHALIDYAQELEEDDSLTARVERHGDS